MSARYLLILAAITVGAYGSVHDHFRHKYFVGGNDVNEYIPDVVLQSRAKHILQCCMKYSDKYLPENKNVSFIQLEKPPASVVDGHHVIINTVPQVEICAPFGVATNGIKALLEEFKQTEKKNNKRPFKTLLVVNPFTRLAFMYRNLESGSGDNFYKQLKSTIEKFAPNQKMNFKAFATFILEGNLNTSSVRGPETREILKKFLPYHYHCQSCQKNIFPQFVLKLDDHFEDDFASFAEDTGIEDLGIGADVFLRDVLPSREQTTKLFSELTTEQFENLVVKYRVDFDMYQYSPEEFKSHAI